MLSEDDFWIEARPDVAPQGARSKQNIRNVDHPCNIACMTVSKLKKCPTCIGIGACTEGDKCPTCEGTGEIPSDEVVIDDPCQPVMNAS